jgi:RNA recognition motif-containing protein
MNDYIAELEGRKARASHYLMQRGFDLVHQFGQRIATNCAVNPDYINTVQYSEIFIGRLPRDLFEDELFPHLMQMGGTILKIRYMMDFSGSNRGFCFVKFANPREAILATRLLNGKILRPQNDPIGVKISFDNKCLFFGNLPPNCTAQQLVRALVRAEIGGIVDARMADNFQRGPPKQVLDCQGGLSMAMYEDPSRGRQRRSRQPKPTSRFGYVYFATHDAATKARRLLMPNEVKILDRKITLDWAKSEIPSDIVNAANSMSNSDLVAFDHWNQMLGGNTLMGSSSPIETHQPQAIL